jgi:hypothetical protein
VGAAAQPLEIPLLPPTPRLPVPDAPAPCDPPVPPPPAPPVPPLVVPPLVLLELLDPVEVEELLLEVDVDELLELLLELPVGVQHCSDAGPGQKPGVET